MPANRKRCLACRHFRNGPRYLESVFKGMNILSSAYGSVRGNDGICLLRDVYLSADACCDASVPSEASSREVESGSGTASDDRERIRSSR